MSVSSKAPNLESKRRRSRRLRILERCSTCLGISLCPSNEQSFHGVSCSRASTSDSNAATCSALRSRPYAASLGTCTWMASPFSQAVPLSFGRHLFNSQQLARFLIDYNIDLAACAGTMSSPRVHREGAFGASHESVGNGSIGEVLLKTSVHYSPTELLWRGVWSTNDRDVWPMSPSSKSIRFGSSDAFVCLGSTTASSSEPFRL